MSRWNALVLVVLCVGGTRTASAQDSSRADWRRWFAIRDSVARCSKYPEIMQFLGTTGEITVHRTPSGGKCQVGPGPGQPTVWDVDSKIFCPDSSAATWMDQPRKVRYDEN